jgi:hypothetical protein
MLSQVNHWIEIVGTAVDALLLLRILQLRLHRVYFFITLSVLLTLFFDGVMLYFHSESREFARIFFFSRFLWAFVLPAAAYDVWEEVKEHLARIRRFAAFRLLSSLVIAAIIGLIISSAAGDDDESGSLLATFAILLWASASTASLAFLWSVNRMARAQKIEFPSNTSVWLLFFQLSLAAEVLTCLLIIVNQQFSQFVTAVVDVSLGLYSILITLWCIWKLRALPAEPSPAPESASLS